MDHNKVVSNVFENASFLLYNIIYLSLRFDKSGIFL